MSAPMPDESELAVLAARYRGQPEALESKLLAAFLQLNQCWHCQAELDPEEHPSCQDCPPWQPNFERSRKVSH